MPLRIHQTSAFKRDIKKMLRQGKEMAELHAAISVLSQDNTLDIRYRDHALIGNWAAHRECHIASDWLLIYRREGNVLYLERTGSHSELFNK